MFLLISLLSSRVQAATPSNVGSWTQRTALPYGVGSDQAAAVLDESIYIVTWQETLFVYDQSLDTWRNQSTVPLPQGGTLAHYGLYACGNKLYVMGDAHNNDKFFYINEAYDPATDSWENKTPSSSCGPMPAQAVNDKIYFIGGAGGVGGEIPALQSNVVYDAANDTWSRAAPVPTAVFGYASAVWNNKIFIIGGCTSAFSGGSLPRYNCTRAVQIYDPATDQWSEGTPLPQAMIAMGAAAASDRIYVVGGWAGKYNDKGPTEVRWPGLGIATFDLNQIYDPQTGAWSTGTPFPVAARDVCLLNSYGRLYALGGQDETLTYLATNYRYTPEGWSMPIETRTVQATANNGAAVPLTFTGNVSAPQITNVTLSRTVVSQSLTATFSFDLAGATGDFGFENVTVPKSAVPKRAVPVVYVDGEQAAAQGWTEDGDSYYVWFGALFGSHHVDIVFPTPAAYHDWDGPFTIYAATATAAAVASAAVLLIEKRKKTRKP
jgi:hypothetical protein